MMQDKLNKLAAFLGGYPDRCSESSWRPPADVYRTLTGWLIKYDLAGVTTKDIAIDIAGASVTIHGSRRDWRLEEGCRHHAMEIAYSRFERTIELPCELERAQLTIQWRDGILLLRLVCQGEPS